MSDLNHEFFEEIKKFQQIYSKMLVDERWQQSPFLKIMYAKLSKFNDELSELLDEPELSSVNVESPQSLSTLDDNFQKVFIYLYSADGKKLDAWQRVVENLDRQFVTRPIYENEIDVQDVVIQAPVLLNAGYVAVWVEKKYIIQSTEVDDLKDKFGRKLISLKDRAINLGRVEYFWNNYAQYSWQNSKLTFSKLAERLQK